jgi:hypothetical protein
VPGAQAVLPVASGPDSFCGGTVANIEIQIPEELGLSKKEKAALQQAFQKQLVETLGANTAAIAKSKLMVVDVRAKSKNEVV